MEVLLASTAATKSICNTSVGVRNSARRLPAQQPQQVSCVHGTRASFPDIEPLRVSRRDAAASLLVGMITLGAPAAAEAQDEAESPAAPKNELIERLLERTRANKAKYDKERLESYNKRNFKDYFEFVEGSIRNKQELTEAEKGIIEWLKRNR